MTSPGPATVGTTLDDDRRYVMVSCTECHHEARINIDDMPRETAIPDIARKMICSQCGSKRCQSRPCSTEYYEKLREKTGLSLGVGKADHP